MTLWTGKGSRYRYYTCSTKARQGETGCVGRSVPMEKLGNLVAGHIEPACWLRNGWRKFSPQSLTVARSAPSGGACISPS
jgi:hypothetical protein